MWIKKGIQPYVYTRSQHHKRLNVFGWVDPVHGLHGMMKWVKGNTDGFLKLLSRIVSRFKGKTIDLWVDRAKWHKGKRVAMFIYEETTNAFFDDIEDMEGAVFKRSQRWKPNKIKTLCQLI
jgi:hypothetical protein